MRMLDLFCGRLGWTKAFLARGWECVGVDLVEPPEIPQGFTFVKGDITDIWVDPLRDICLDFEREFVIRPPDFICASPPCEQFSVHGMKHFHPNPPYPQQGIILFEFTRELCEGIGVPYVIENVRAAQQFVGQAQHHCGPFYLWGTGVPPLVNQGIRKGVRLGKSGFTGEAQREWRRQNDPTWNLSESKARQEATARIATIPPELAKSIADYAERILEQR